jgi:putative DNA primase/helicase
LRLDEFEHLFDRVRRSGDGFTCRCPAHEDDRASLHVDFKNGKILMRCFAGCEVQSIVDVLHLQMSDLFDDDNDDYKRRPAYPREKMHVQADAPKKIAATYPYTDREGKVLYEVVRYEPKDFRQRHGDVWNLDGVERVIFNLPAVEEAIDRDEVIFYVEGEKDVLSLAKIGLVGTTHCGGSSGWRGAYSTFLRGAKLVVLPDNDAPGKKMASEIKASVDGAAILELPGLPSKGDVSDWIAAGGTADALLVMADEALSLFSPIQLDRFLAEKGELDWLVPNFLVRGAVAQLTAKPAAGKTTLLVQMALQLACGEPFLGMKPTKPVKTLYLMAEGARPGFKGRVRLACQTLGITGSRLKEIPWMIQPEKATSKVKLGSDELRKMIGAAKADLVILDTQRYFKMGGEENSADDWLKFFMEPMRALTAEFGCGFFLVHHFKKSGDDLQDDEKQRGTSAQIGDVDVSMRLEIEKPRGQAVRRGAAPAEELHAKKTMYRRFVEDKNKYAPEFDIRLEMDFLRGRAVEVDEER